jgi:hypothetical protein
MRILSFDIAIKRLGLLIVTALMALCLVSAPAGAVSVGGPSDCDSNAIIRCGAHSTSALISAYQSSNYVQKVFAFYGISSNDMSNLPSTDKVGRVTKGGDVFIEGQSRPVATNAITGGRQDMPGSTRVNFEGAVFFKRPPSASFQQESLPAFVSMSNGRFQFAVLASCGNAIKATPVRPPQTQTTAPTPTSTPTPTPTPTTPAPAAPTPAAPAQTQSQSQSQQVVVQQQVEQVTQAPPTPAPVPQPAPVAAAPAPAPAPTVLPNTGPAGMAGIFAASSLAGVWGYRRLLIRRL